MADKDVLQTATVREALTFSALLRQPARFTKQDRLDYVDEVIKLLEMHPYADAVVGVPGEGAFLPTPNAHPYRGLTLFLQPQVSMLNKSVPFTCCSSV